MKRLLSIAMLALAVFATAVVAQAADVTVGQSGWNWGNPQPQGNTLRTVEFAGGRGYAAGDFGTLLRTDDGGRNWVGIPTGITANLSRIRAVNQDTVVIGSGCVLRRSDDGGTTFKRLRYNGSEASCPTTIASLYFPSPDIGYVVASDGSVVRTANGGSTFSGREAVPGTERTGGNGAPTDVFFITPDMGFATTKGPGGGIVYKTTDGGFTWTAKATVPQGLNGLYFADPGVGYAVGDGNALLRTTDGGETWEPKPIGGDIPGNDLTSIRCSTTVSCLISTASGDRVLRTTDGGATFTAFSPSTRKIYAVSFASASSAVGVGERGATVLSTNVDSENSPSFVPVGDQPLQGSFNRMRATSTTLVYAPGDNGKLARTEDGGHHWSTLQVPTSEDLLDSWFVSENDGYVLDVAGKALSTADGGGSWSLLDTGTTDRPQAVYAPNTSLVLLFGPRGVRRSEDAGQTFAPVDSKAARTATLVDYDRTSTSTLYAYGPKGLIVSSDIGASWKKVKGPVKKPRYQKVDFVNTKVGYALMTDGRAYKTINGGKTWRDMTPGVGSSNAYDVSFGDSDNGFLSVPSFGAGSTGLEGWVLRTSDGGRTWRPQLIEPSTLAPRGLATPAASTAFALGGTSDLFYTTFGGDAGTPTTLTIASKTKRIKKTKTVKITGRLSPTVAGADVVVSARDPKTNRWRRVGVPTVSSSGTFTSTFRVSRTTQFVAQWRGDADNNGDGSPAITVVKTKSAKKKR